MLEIKNLSYRYHPSAPWALKNVCLSLPNHGILGLLGHNGAGKSTLLSVLAGLYAVGGDAIHDDQSNVLDAQDLIKLVSIVPQDFAFYQSLTVKQNLQLFHQIASNNQTVETLDQVISMCGLSDLLPRQVAQLSGGQKRKLNLAIGLIKNAKILLLDEPTVGIDPQTKIDLLKVIKSLADTGKVIVYTSHILHEVEQVCDYFCILHNGSVKLAPTSLKDLNSNRQTLIQLESAEDKNKLNILLESFSKQWLNTDTVVINNLQSSYADLLGKIEQARITLRSSSFGSGALEQLYLSLTREAV